MSSQRILCAAAAVALFAVVPGSADAQYYSGSYSTFYQPYTSYYQPYTSYYNGGYTSYYGGGGGGCCGNGYTTNYGGGYGGNAFAPLVPSPYSGFGWFGSGYTAAYGPAYGGGGCSPCGCSPCGSGCGYGCATGNCSIPASSEQPAPAPDNGVPYDSEEPMRTYGDPPMDDRGFRPGGSETDGTGDGSFPGGLEENEAFKITPMNTDETELPKERSQPESGPLDADKPNKPNDDNSSVPGVQYDLHVPSPGPITPRNSARVEPASHLDWRITWRSNPVIVPQRQPVIVSRPLIVRKTVKVQLNAVPPTLVSQSNAGR